MVAPTYVSWFMARTVEDAGPYKNDESLNFALKVAVFYSFQHDHDTYYHKRGGDDVRTFWYDERGGGVSLEFGWREPHI